MTSSVVFTDSPLPSLQQLLLAHNSLTDAAFLPRLGTHSPGLEIVDLSFNRITLVPRSLFLTVEPALRVLRLQVSWGIADPSLLLEDIFRSGCQYCDVVLANCCIPWLCLCPTMGPR